MFIRTSIPYPMWFTHDPPIFSSSFSKLPILKNFCTYFLKEFSGLSWCLFGYSVSSHLPLHNCLDTGSFAQGKYQSDDLLQRGSAAHLWLAMSCQDVPSSHFSWWHTCTLPALISGRVGSNTLWQSKFKVGLLFSTHQLRGIVCDHMNP